MLDLVICGPPGTKKTSAMRRIIELYPDDATPSPRYNTAKRRIGDVEGMEYFFDISDEEFDRKLDVGFLLSKESYGENAVGTTEHLDGTVTRRGTVHPRHWPIPESRNGFRVHVLGPTFAHVIASMFPRNMKIIYFAASPDLALETVGKRYRGPYSIEKGHWSNIIKYKELGLEELYRKHHNVINVDGRDVDPIVQEIIDIARLPRPKPMRIGVPTKGKVKRY